MKKRLSKVLAGCGVASRRAAEELIFAGQVKVNGKVVTLPQTLVSLDEDVVTVHGKKLESEEKKVYFLLNKPLGYICSNKRLHENSKLVIDFFESLNLRLFTVGRLDKDTEGLILVTNDGHFADKLIHPSSNVQKEYLAKTATDINHLHLINISNGTDIEGTFIKPVKVEKVRRGTIKIIVKEGKKHEVRILLESAGVKIKHLSRIRIGHITLGPLPVGSWRELTKAEINEVLA